MTRICSICRNHILTLFPLMTQRICNKSNMTGVTSGAGTAYPSGEHGFTPVLSGIRVGQYLVFYVVVFLYHGCLFLLFLFGHCVVCSSIQKKETEKHFCQDMKKKESTQCNSMALKDYITVLGFLDHELQINPFPFAFFFSEFSVFLRCDRQIRLSPFRY